MDKEGKRREVEGWEEKGRAEHKRTGRGKEIK